MLLNEMEYEQLVEVCPMKKTNIFKIRINLCFHTLPISALSEPTVLLSAADTSVLWYDGATISDMEG